MSSGRHYAPAAPSDSSAWQTFPSRSASHSIVGSGSRKAKAMLAAVMPDWDQSTQTRVVAPAEPVDDHGAVARHGLER